jgi:cell wall-associated NlpC family hydrolase
MRYPSRPLLALAALALLAPALPAPAAASPLDDKRAQAARLQQQIDANGDRIAALGEEYNGARIAYDRAAAGIAEAQRRFDAAQAEVDAKRRVLERRAVRLYTDAGRSSPLKSIDVRSVDELGRRDKYGSIASAVDGAAITRLRIAQEDLAHQRRLLEEQQAAARAHRDAAAASKRRFESANAQQEQLLGRVKGEIATLVEQERQRREADARRAAAARVAAPRRAPGPVDPGSVGGNLPVGVAPSAGVAAVIAYARAQLGKPYSFATAGPDTFDCSGLTMMAWRQAGVSMAHFSGAQFNAFPHVPISALQPGDLVFKGPGGRDHVALYVGGGMQIAATHTGDYVRLQPLSRNLSGAVRPG